MKAHAILKRVSIALIAGITVAVPNAADGGKIDYLATVRAYADCLIEHGRDTYGEVHSPLFAEALDRRTLRLLEGESLERAAALKRADWGIRLHDRTLTGANPMHCQNFFQILYALTEITGEPRYATEADQSLEFFFNNCQGPVTGLFYWGEHAGWDFRSDAPRTGTAWWTHEFYRPWVLWDRSWDLAPEACRKFALGLWEHQIGDHETGAFSRHARIDIHAPQTGAPYPRHGGFYVETWAKAYEKTGEKVFLKAIEVVVDGLETMRLSGGMIVRSGTDSDTAPRDGSLAVSLWDAAGMLPPALGAKLRRIARANDGPPYVAAGDGGISEPGQDPNLWSDGYGRVGGQIASPANLQMLRYRQDRPEGYRERILATADPYLADEVNLSFPVHPGTVGKVIILMLDAHELTGRKTYLERADYFAGEAIRLFLDDDCPLPKATHVHDHYEAVTGADTLMMSLLQLWAAKQDPSPNLSLIYTDR